MPPKSARKSVKENKKRPTKGGKSVAPFGGKVKPSKKVIMVSSEEDEDSKASNEVVAATGGGGLVTALQAAYVPTFFNLSTDDITHKQPSSDVLRATFPKKQFFGVRAFSTKGIKLGQSNATVYVKIQGDYITKEEIIASDAIPDLKSVGLANALRNVDFYAREAYAVIYEDLLGMWPTISGVIFRNGLMDEDTKKIGGKVEYCLFPHRQWTAVYEVDTTKPGALPVKKKIEHCFSKTGNSEFIFMLTVSCVEFRYEGGYVTVQPFVNVNTVTWLNAGQDCSVGEELEEAERVEQQISSIQAILSRSSDVVLK